MLNSDSILLVDSDPESVARVSEALQGVIKTHSVQSGKAALRALSERPYPVILIAQSLPDGEGVSFCSAIRSLPNGIQPTIAILGTRRRISEKLKSFELGADDYILKPFDRREFRARVVCKLRTIKRLLNPNLAIVKGPFSVHLGQQRLAILNGTKGEIPVELTGNQFKILLYLIRHDEKPVSRQELLHEIWGQDARVSGRTIDTHMHAIRQQLGDYAKYVKSVHGKGYCFTVRRVVGNAS